MTEVMMFRALSLVHHFLARHPERSFIFSVILSGVCVAKDLADAQRRRH
jgi:hypothetical protein